MNHQFSAALMLSAMATACVPALADEAVAPENNLSVTTTLASDYIFRGMTQTWNQPAVQASIDYTHSSGAFASLWASNVDDKIVAGTHTELDFTVGYRGTVGDVGYSTTLLHVMYPGANYKDIRYANFSSQKYDFTELGLGVTYKWLSFKYNYTLTDMMGFNETTGFTGKTRGSTYADLNLDIPLPSSFTLGLHAGRQDIKADLVNPTAGGSTNPDFTDYRISLSRLFPDNWNAMVAYTWNNNRAFYDHTVSNLDASDTCNVGAKRFSVMLSKTF